LKKYTFIFAISSLFLLAISFISNNTSASVQIIISSPSLNSYEIAENIKNELSKIDGVCYYELSFPSKSALVNYDDERVDNIDILAAFNKWGCKDFEISYNPIF